MPLKGSAKAKLKKASARPRDDEPLSIRQLEVFVALIDHGSFTKAAQNLGLSQPTVSGHMGDLEQRLGLRLIDRNRLGLRATNEGRSLLRSAREALHCERNVRTGAADLKGLVAGRVVVGGSSIPTTYILPEKLAAFRRENPEVRLELRSGSSNEMLNALSDGEIDVAVVGTEPPRRHPVPLQSKPLFDDRLVFVCAPGNSLLESSPIARERILEQTLIIRPPGSGTRDAMQLALNVQDVDWSHLDTVQVETNEAVKASVCAGLGVSMVSEVSVCEELRVGSLVSPRLRGGKERKRTFWLVHRRDTQLGPAATSLRSAFLN